MLRFANPQTPVEAARKPVNLWQVIGLALIGVVALVLLILFTKAFFVVLFGVIGAAAGYLLHNFQDHQNPIPAMRSVFGLRRSYAVALLSAIAGLIAFLIFVKGIALSQDAVVAQAVFKCAANGFFAFSISSFVFGRRSIAHARRKFARAESDQIHFWQMDAAAERKRRAGPSKAV